MIESMTIKPQIKSDTTGVKIRDIIARQNFSSSQQTALKRIDSFLKDPDQHCFMLSGYAGTGKSYIIKTLVQYLGNNNIHTKIMTPTGRSARILSEKFNIFAKTIHKSIYHMKDLIEYKDTSGRNIVTYKYYYNLLNNECEHGTVFIIDEASMISNVYNEQEFIRFGSGRLLQDLMEYIGFDQNDYCKKVIFVGDDAQLPPVGMNFSPALSPEYFRQHFDIEPQTCRLTEVLRQHQESLVLKNAFNIRKLLDRRTYNEFSFTYDNHSVLKMGSRELMDKFLDIFNNKSKSDPLLIVYSNALANSYNISLRAKLFPQKKEISAGDRIISVRNNYGYQIEIMNGQMGFVKAIKSGTIVRHVPVNTGKFEFGKQKIKSVRLSFRDVDLEFEDSNREKRTITATIIENILHNDQAGLSSIESKALYVDFAKRHPHLKPGTEEFKRAIKKDKYFNALQIKFAYAITCHKSQGGEWQNVFVDLQGRNKLNRENLRWTYTAITRSKQNLYLCNPIVQNILTPQKMTFKNLPLQNKKSVKANILESSVNTAPAIPDSLQQASYKSQKIYQRLRPYLPNALVVRNSTSRPYQEIYHVNLHNTSFKIIVFYNQHNFISRVKFNKKIEGLPVSATELTQKLQHFCFDNNRNKQRQENSIPTDCQTPFFKKLASLLKKKNICYWIQKQSVYHYTVKISRDMESGMFDYYFDKNQQFTKFFPRQNSSSEKLFKELLLLHGDSVRSTVNFET
jgi:hypothetical protein